MPLTFVRDSEQLGAVIPSLAAGNSAAVNGAALAAAVAAANARGGWVKLPAGSFPMSCTLTSSATIEFSPRTTFLQSTAASCLLLDFESAMVGPHTVSSITTVVHPNVSSTTARVSRITVPAADAVNYQRGDGILIQSEDKRTYYATTDANFAGEVAKVIGVDTVNGYIYTDGLLRFASLYVTNTRLWRLARNTVKLIRPRFEWSGADPYTALGLGVIAPVLGIVGAVSPSIEGYALELGAGIGLEMRACADPSVTVDRVAECAGNPSEGRYGYAIAATVSRGVNVSGGRFGPCRHPFTTNCRQRDTYDIANKTRHGDCTDVLLADMTAEGGEVSFGFHEPTDGGFVKNCVARYSRRNILSTNPLTGAGFDVRGRNITFVGCEAIDCEVGWDVESTAANYGLANEIMFSGCRHTGEAANNLNVRSFIVHGNASVASPAKVTIQGQLPGVASRWLEAESGYVGVIDVLHSRIAGVADTQVRLRGNSTLRVAGTQVDMSATGSGERLISVEDNASATVVATDVGIVPNASFQGLVHATAGSTVTVRHRGVHSLTTTAISLSSGTGTVNASAITSL